MLYVLFHIAILHTRAPRLVTHNVALIGALEDSHAANSEAKLAARGNGVDGLLFEFLLQVGIALVGLTAHLQVTNGWLLHALSQVLENDVI